MDSEILFWLITVITAFASIGILLVLNRRNNNDLYVDLD